MERQPTQQQVQEEVILLGVERTTPANSKAVGFAPLPECRVPRRDQSGHCAHGVGLSFFTKIGRGVNKAGFVSSAGDLHVTRPANSFCIRPNRGDTAWQTGRQQTDRKARTLMKFDKLAN